MVTPGNEGAGGTDVSAEPSYKRVEREHRQIIALLTDLEQATEPKRVLEIADELGGLLPDHFANEESEGGVLDEIALDRPDLAPRLSTIRGQHQELVDVLEAVRREARANPADASRMHQRKEEFGWKLREHERVEAGLIVDFYYTEEGGRG